MDIRDEIPVTYTDGVFRPEERVNLPEGARVTITVRPRPDATMTPEQAMDLIKRISASGSFNSHGRKYTRDELYDRDERR